VRLDRVIGDEGRQHVAESVIAVDQRVVATPEPDGPDDRDDSECADRARQEDADVRVDIDSEEMEEIGHVSLYLDRQVREGV